MTDNKKIKRKKIPSNIEAEVMFRSKRLCCIDQKRGDHIHHIDGDSSNYDFSNLALLCFDCHDEASWHTGKLRKGLSQKTIIKFREHHYNVIQSEREKSLKNIDTPIQYLSSGDLLTASITSLVLIEVIKIKDEYYQSAKIDRTKILDKFEKFAGITNGRIAYEIFSFLSQVAYEARTDMLSRTARSLQSLTSAFFPHMTMPKDKKLLLELSSQCIQIGFTLIYDSLIHRKNIFIAGCGHLILKSIYLKDRNNNFSELKSKVIAAYDELSSNLNRPERSDLNDAKRLLKIFKIDLEYPFLTMPLLPDDLLKQFDNDYEK